MRIKIIYPSDGSMSAEEADQISEGRPPREAKKQIQYDLFNEFGTMPRSRSE